MVSNRKQPIVHGAFFVLLVFLQACRNSIRRIENLWVDRSPAQSFHRWGKFAVALLVFVLSLGSAEARTWLVTADQAGDAPTIQAALDSAATADTVLVAAGFYDENLDTLGKQLVLLSEAGAENTIVDGGRRGRVLTLSGGGIVQGFTFRQGQAARGGGVWIGTQRAILRNNIIEDNIAGFILDNGQGGGVFLSPVLDGQASVVEFNIIRNNIAGDSGGGICDSGAKNELRENVIADNSCHVGGGGAVVNGVFVGNLVIGNWSDIFGGGVWAPGVFAIRNNTIIGNNSGNDFSAGILVTGGATVSQNIIVGNGTASLGNPGAGIVCALFASPVITCNDLWGNGIDSIVGCDAIGDGNISADPLFCNDTQDDFRLAKDSPCAPSQNSCGLLGAFGVNCVITQVETKTWGQLKRLYR